ncbi:MAG: HPr family phosphocarrier protein [Acidimicrobiia bacterium]|nr:HPr family phosphocarrier protein [Acidimicrobiia bacterium]
MIDSTITVTHEVGLHARPAATFVKKAAEFQSAITIENLTRGGDPMNAKSVVSVFKAAVAQGHDVKIVANGSDEQEALSALVGLIESNFGE